MTKALELLNEIEALQVYEKELCWQYYMTKDKSHKEMLHSVSKCIKGLQENMYRVYNKGNK